MIDASSIPRTREVVSVLAATLSCLLASSPALAKERTAEVLIWGGGESQADADKALERWNEVEATSGILPAPNYPSIIKSEGMRGLKPGFYIVVIGICDHAASAARLERLRAFEKGAYARTVTIDVQGELPCPADQGDLLASAGVKEGRVLARVEADSGTFALVAPRGAKDPTLFWVRQGKRPISAPLGEVEDPLHLRGESTAWTVERDYLELSPTEKAIAVLGESKFEDGTAKGSQTDLHLFRLHGAGLAEVFADVLARKSEDPHGGSSREMDVTAATSSHHGLYDLDVLVDETDESEASEDSQSSHQHHHRILRFDGSSYQSE